MSLLLDALKRAEQEKLARGDRPDLQVVGDAPPSSAPAGLSHAPSAANASLELQPLGGGGSKGPASPAHGPAAASGGKAAQTPAQAQVVFQAKAGQADSPKRGLIYAAAGTIIVAVIAAGAYVWYVMQSLASPSSLARTPSRAATPAAPAAPAAQTAEKAMAALLPPVPPPSAATTPPAGPAAAAPTTPPSSTPSAAAPAEARKPPPGAAPTRDEIVQELLRQPAARREAPLRLDRAVAPKVAPSVANGYELLRQGDLQAARGAYQSALAADPSSVDATLGIATIEARSGRVAAAVEAYRRALELDPRNETAVAGLAAMADGSRQASLETHLRQDAARTPTSGALRFALGNVLAGERRWSEAQAEYFEAHRLDPGNPDIMHNLAVSLDNLGQARLARDFYRRALDASRSQRAQFDPAAVERRLAELGS